MVSGTLLLSVVLAVVVIWLIVYSVRRSSQGTTGLANPRAGNGAAPFDGSDASCGSGTDGGACGGDGGGSS
jgi:hypothetical protein